ncbi:MAG: alanine racemase [Oscillospiraceae bacterium]|nr:alanine racemase [Oscillospiraceae bacterium]
MEWLKRTWATVSLDDLYHNYKQIREHIDGDAKFMGVVKADAYGHGAIAISRALAEFGADYLAVSNLEEAIQIRNAGIKLPILILGYTPPSFAPELVYRNITQTVYSFGYAQELSQALCGMGECLRIHLKIDTGMARIGFLSYNSEQALQAAARAASLSGLMAEGIFTHFSSADSTAEDAVSFTQLQYDRFSHALDYLKGLGVEFQLRHCCNSGAIVHYPQYAMDMVRAGIITYGLPSSADLKNRLDLRPIMTLQTVVSHIKEIPQESPVGYSRTYKTPSVKRIATLPIGYADGYSVALSGQVKVLIRGKSYPVVGRICMDMCMIDITDALEIQVGEIVTVVGSDNSWDNMANLLHTIPYEVVCRISKRVPRVYTRNGEEVDILRYIC